METALKTDTLKDRLATEFQTSKHSLFGNLNLREDAMSSFMNLGIPNRKSEEYKYVNIDLTLKGEFVFATNKTLSCEDIKHSKFLKDSIDIVIENGIFIEGLSSIQSLPKGVRIINIAEASTDSCFEKEYAKYADIKTDAFVALNTALAKGGVFIHIAAGVIIDAPIRIMNISTADERLFTNSRNLIVVEPNAQARFVESFETIACSALTFTNALTELVVSENAVVDYTKIEDGKENGYLVSTTQVYQKKQSVFTTNSITLSGSLVRNNLNIVLDDEHIETHLNGLYLTNGHQVVDNHTLVDHRKPNCNSNELYKGIIEDKSTATFNGKIFVRKDAQKTNAFQSNKNILLSDDGTINTKPQLEIYADDVKCSHGTSTGKLDAEKIFYLQARGLSETTAKKLLMHAFASEVVDTLKIEELRDWVEEKISMRFE